VFSNILKQVEFLHSCDLSCIMVAYLLETLKSLPDELVLIGLTELYRKNVMDAATIGLTLVSLRLKMDLEVISYK